MKRGSLLFIILILLCGSYPCRGEYPFVRNFPKSSWGGGAQTWAIAQMESGVMLFANNAGLLEFDGGSWTVHKMGNLTSARSLYLDSELGRIYVGGTNELRYWQWNGTEGEESASLLDSLGLSTTEIWAIGRSGEGKIWFEDDSYHYVLDNPGISYSHIPKQTRSMVPCTAENEEYSAEASTGNGVKIVRKRTGEVFILNTENGLQNNTVLSMAFDRDGNLWLGLDNGIDLVLLGSPFYRLLGDDGQSGIGYAYQRWGGQEYIGANTGLFRLRGWQKIEGIEGPVWNLLEADGRLFCCHDTGITVLREGRIESHIPMAGCWKLEPLLGHPDRMLGSSYGHLFLLEKQGGKWESVHPLEGFDLASKAFEQDSCGLIWFSHHVRGLFCLELSDDQRSVASVRPVGTNIGFPTNNNNVPHEYRDDIVFSTEGGFWTYDRASGRVQWDDELNAVFPRQLISCSIYESPERDLRYFSSGSVQAMEYLRSDGVRVLDTLSMRPLVGNRPLGFECIRKLDENHLLINTEDGFDVVQMQNLSEAGPESGELLVKSVRLTSTGRVIYDSRRPGRGVMLGQLRSSENSLRLDFVLPDYMDRVTYRCRLEGLDKDFSPSEGNFKEYVKLPYGQYTFRVQATTRGGETLEDSVRFVIRRPWYLSMPMVMLYVVGVFGLFLFLGWASEKYYSRKEEKARMKRDIERKSDDLAASTMNVIRKNELLQRIGSEVDRSIEGLKGGEDKEDLLRRLRQLTSLIDSNMVHDDDWQKFADNFDVVYSDYLKRLSKAYPALTLQDQRLCAYLRMGLSSKAIAPLLGMSVHSVETTRYRLRKKLGLSKEDNLSNFLQHF